MTGIERLVDIVNDGPYSGGMVHISVQRLREICEQIEGEADDISGRDSDVLAWVEEHGGLDAVKKRLMPEDMSWPFYEDGEPVRIGEYVICDERCSPAAVDCIEFNDSGFKLYGESGHLIAGSVMPYGERVKRPAPKVLDAYGEEIREGETVWSLGGGGPYTVAGFGVGTPYVLCEDGAGNVPALEPSALTHRAPVLASDGKPLEVGQTVYHIADGKEYTVEKLFEDGAMVTPDGITGGRCRAEYLTHQRTDSWGRWIEDAGKSPCEYFGSFGTSCDGCQHDPCMCGSDRNEDLVRRAKALAGVSE